MPALHGPFRFAHCPLTLALSWALVWGAAHAETVPLTAKPQGGGQTRPAAVSGKVAMDPAAVALRPATPPAVSTATQVPPPANPNEPLLPPPGKESVSHTPAVPAAVAPAASHGRVPPSTPTPHVDRSASRVKKSQKTVAHAHEPVVKTRRHHADPPAAPEGGRKQQVGQRAPGKAAPQSGQRLAHGTKVAAPASARATTARHTRAQSLAASKAAPSVKTAKVVKAAKPDHVAKAGGKAAKATQAGKVPQASAVAKAGKSGKSGKGVVVASASSKRTAQRVAKAPLAKASAPGAARHKAARPSRHHHAAA